ncbi:DUF1289 domain-containing protein [Tolumonas lignilytica]|uniref:DUF1289 domain-containing protein n=1 Tax=Tolumonas lignilytica TaxID=1283284 RepID=UPI000463F374|nr:DUF1289 domain-containing protein [Tolumonas lignilytica]
MGEANHQEQLELFPIPSPCIGYCQTDNKGYCLGCFRSREERFNWLKYTPPQQREIIRLCKQRKYRRLLAAQQKQATPEDEASTTLPLFGDDYEA